MIDCLGKFCEGVQPGEGRFMAFDDLAERRLNDGLLKRILRRSVARRGRIYDI
jgi:hypothetical protein